MICALPILGNMAKKDYRNCGMTIMFCDAIGLYPFCEAYAFCGAYAFCEAYMFCDAIGL